MKDIKDLEHMNIGEDCYQFPKYMALKDIILDNYNKYRNFSCFQNLKNLIYFSKIKDNINNRVFIYIEYKSECNKKIKLFGKEFYKKNKNKYNMIINGNTKELEEEYLSKEPDILKIMLVEKPSSSNENKEEIDRSNLFNGCKDLLNLIFIYEDLIPGKTLIEKSIWKNIQKIKCMFYGCSSLKSLPDLSKLKTNNITNMNMMLYGCSSLKYLTDLSKWKTNNVTTMNMMFYGCSSLKSLPHLSKWKTNNATTMNMMFYRCSSLKYLPDLSKWETNNVTYMSMMFNKCSSLKSLPDISKWKTNNITNMNMMFYGCSSLKSLPELSNWKTDNVVDMSEMFYGCNSLHYLKGLSEWKTNKVKYMKKLWLFLSTFNI